MNYFELEYENNIAILWLNQADSAVNTLSPAIFDACEQVFEELENNEQVTAIVLISRKKDFVAGADLEALYAINELHVWEKEARRAHTLLKKMEKSKKPIVCAMHGATVGGGLEIALACQYRIATDSPRTFFSLPEVKLGLLPGGGGTQRLPHLIGLTSALDMMLTGRNIYVHKAKKLGLVDKIVHQHSLLRVAKQQAKAMAGKKIVRPTKRKFSDKLVESNLFTRKMVLNKAYAEIVKKTHGNYPAPFKIIDCVRMGSSYGRDIGFEAEMQKLDELVVHPVTKRLIELFFAMNAKKKNALEGLAKPIKKIAMVGAGFMGEGIAQVSINKAIPVLLKDINNVQLQQAQQNIWKQLNKKIRQKALSPAQAEKQMNLLNPQLQYTQFSQADIVIEAVFEDIDIKHQIVAQCEAATPSHCIFASNTSALPISKIAEKSSRPSQVIGMHYFSPVPKMPLLEIVTTPQTADWVVATAVSLGIKQGKTCIVVKDGPGFYTTRILAPLLNEALLLLEEGAAIKQVDKVAQQLGFPVGPITLIDEVGIDVGAHIMQGELMRFFQVRNPDMKICKALGEMAAAGYKGRKNKQGFYRYNKQGKKQKGKVNNAVYDYFGGQERLPFTSKEIRQRLQLIMTNEAAYCLQEGIIEHPSDGDIGAILGLGYPPFTGGPFRYLDSIGCAKATKRLNDLSATHGPRFAPANILVRYAEEGKRFYL